MLSKLLNLVVKETKDMMRDPKILIGMVIMPLLIFPAMGYAIKTSMETAVKAAEKVEVAVLNFDKGVYSEKLLAYISSIPSSTVKVYDETNITRAALKAMEEGYSTLLVIPRGFSKNITEGLRSTLILYSIIKSISIAETGKSEVFKNVLSSFEEDVVVENIKSIAPGKNPEYLLDPLYSVEYTVVKGNIVKAPPEALFSIFMSQSFAVPFIVMMLLIFAMQIAATSIAMEKEQKTLETLLTIPIGRMSILTGKLVGSVVIAALGAVSYMVGFTYYFNAALSLPTQAARGIFGGLSFNLTFEGLVLIGVLLFVTILSGLALAISVAVFAEDVRSAQTLVGYLYVPIFLPVFFTMFTDIESLPPTIAYIILAIPYSHPILAVKSLLLGGYENVGWSILYITVFTIVVLYIAAKIFTTDKILTARFSIRKRRVR